MPPSPRPRILITGLGPVTAFGIGIDPLWNAMLEGRTALSRIRRFDPAGFACQAAAELPDDAFDVKSIVPKSYRKATKVMCRDIELAVGGAAEAVRDAGLTTKATDPDAVATYDPTRFGCHIGAGLISADVDELAAALITSRKADGEFDLAFWGGQGMQNLTPLWLLKYLPNMLACHVTIVHDCQGPSNTITCCEASSLLSLGESMRVIQRGAADACLTGGAEYKLNPLAFIRQQFAGRLAPLREGDDPAAAVKPFDRRAAGTLLGEGGGILVIESAETASKRSASAYAEILSFRATQSRTLDSAGLQLDINDDALAAVLRGAIESAEITINDIDAIVPLGAGIPNSDQAEAAAIKAVFGDRAPGIPLITTIPNTGNCAAGNAAVALSVAAMALRHQKLPARLNTKDAEGLDANAMEARDADLNHILVFTTSQGGQNAAVVLKKV